MSEQRLTVSIIICTSNRAGDLRRTLDALRSVLVPDAMSCELVVVDNASTDDTAEVVKAFRLTQMPVVYVHEPRRGKGYAYNTGMRVARGEVFLFTDDDVRPPPEWIVGMCEPILSGIAHAVAGGVKLAPHLERPWMDVRHRSWVASTERLNAQQPEDMVGANMAFSRGVLEKVPGFDPELGPGALGFGDDTLFSWQLKKAGYTLVSALHVIVEHHPNESRFTRTGFLDCARKIGQTQAYLAHHWEHQVVRFPRLRFLKAKLRLIYWRLRKRRELKNAEGMPDWEVGTVTGLHLYKRYLIERKRPYNYNP